MYRQDKQAGVVLLWLGRLQPKHTRMLRRLGRYTAIHSTADVGPTTQVVLWTRSQRTTSLSYTLWRLYRRNWLRYKLSHLLRWSVSVNLTSLDTEKAW